MRCLLTIDVPEQLEFAGLPRPLFQATPSKLTTFDCPRRYRFAYVDRPAAQKGLPWAHNTLGAAVHVALASWYQLPPGQRTPEMGERLVRKRWQHDGFRDNAMSDAWCDRAAQWVRSYLAEELARRAEDELEPRGIERTVGMRTSMLAVSGRVDRVDEREGELVIVDYKTGRAPLTVDDARGSLALALYTAAAERTFRQRCRRVELHHLPTGQVSVWEHTSESLAQHVERAEQTATDIIACVDTVAGGADPVEVFEPNPGPGCAWCDYRKLCPEGQAVSNQVEQWAGLGELAG